MATENLSTAQAAELLDVSANKVRDMITSGDLPNAFKEGRAWRIPKSDIKALTKSIPAVVIEEVVEAPDRLTSAIAESARELQEEIVEAASEAVPSPGVGSYLQDQHNALSLYLFGSYIAVIVIATLSALFFG